MSEYGFTCLWGRWAIRGGCMLARHSGSARQTGLKAMEGAFLRFGGVPAAVLIDNAKALVEHHDSVTREVRFNARLHAFAR